MKLPFPASMSALLIPALFAVVACAGEPQAERSRSAQPQPGEPAPVTRGSLSPSAPVQLRYRQPEQAPAGVPLAIELQLTTPLKQGELLVEVAKYTGVTLLSAASQSVELTGQTQPIRLPLELVPETGGERYLVLLVSVRTESGPLSRTFRIDLPAAE